jgi:signal transduction histidine kinase
MEAQQKLEGHLQEKLYSEQLLSLGALAKGIAHELNTPITSVLGNVHRLNDYMVRAQQLIVLLVGQDRLNPQVREAMRRTDWDYIKTEFPNISADAVKGLRMIQDIVKDLSFLAGTQQTGSVEKVDADLNQLVDHAIETLQVQVPKNIHIDRHLFLDRPVKVFVTRMEQALINLIANAVQAIPGDGAGSIRVVTRPRGQRAEIEITDTGIGMDEETLSQLFTPFFTTKHPGRGTGLGLSIARSIVKMHEGNIKVSSHKGEGSTFTIDLPM